MKVISDVREAMWGVVESGREPLDVLDFLAYAAEHFERALENASPPESSMRLLEDAADDA